MFKRANKITALLVAAASVMSVVPAMAADHIDTKDGTIKQGFAFENGAYGYFGYRTDSDETGIWYNKGGEAKDSAIEDLDEYEYQNTSKYGEKYAYAINDDNNDDEYIIDLSTGKVVDDETVEEQKDSAQSKLESALKKADRYDALQDANNKLSLDDANYKRVLTGQFGEIWYRATTETEMKYDNFLSELPAPNNITTTAAVVLSKEDGKYIDVSVDANMRVFSTKKGRAVVVDKYDKEYSDAGLMVRLDSVQVLCQDKDNLYTLTKVKVYDLDRNNSVSTQYFIQKISKARSGQDDGAYLPKDVTSYQLDNKKIYDNGDAKDAYDVILGDNLDDKYYAKDNLYSVKDNTLYVARIKNDMVTGKSDKVKIFKLSLSKVKVDTIDNSLIAVDKEEDVDTNLVKKSGDSDHDTVKVDLESKADNTYDNEVSAVGLDQKLSQAVSMDIDGNIWALDKGKVYEYTGSEWKNVYAVDRATDSLDVYNEGNLIAYEKDGGAYTTVQEGKKQTVDNAVETDPTLAQKTPATVGWVQDTATGAWTFYDVNGTKTANYWVNDNGTWYYIKPDGNMATGWAQWNGSWYYLRANGAMATGWVQDTDGKWYYLSASGAMLANTTVDGYKLGPSGAWIQ